MSEPRVFNVDPSPRMLIRGFGGSEPNMPLITRIAELAATPKYIRTLSEVRQSEWDVLVTDQPLGVWNRLGHSEPAAAPTLFVIYVAPPQVGDFAVEHRFNWQGTIDRRTGHIEKYLKRSKDVPDRVQPVVELLEPILRERSRHESFFSDNSNSTQARLVPYAPEITPFAETASNVILAGRYERSKGGVQAWLLPSDVPDIVPWVAAALGEWSAIAPDRFPGAPDWAEQPQWATPEEIRLRDDREELLEQTKKVIAGFQGKDDKLKAQQVTLREQAHQYERGLLTLSDNELVPVVMRALEEFGFTVVDHDALLREQQGDRFRAVQDLDVTDPEDPNWIALAEVKGYTAGAKTSALGQLDTFQRLHRDAAGKWASRLWYVANHFKGRDPSTREKVLQSADVDVDSFAERDGLVIDTVQLFHLLMAVRGERLSQQQVRASLRSQTGRYELPVSDQGVKAPSDVG